MDHEQRIAQFTKMAEADPDNELGHFSLGKALQEAGRPEEAARSFERTLELNPGYSKAYQLLAVCQQELGDSQAALATLGKGIAIADERGDRMPRDAMADQMRQLGQEPPAFKTTTTETVSPEGSDLQCSRCGRPSPRMDKQPFKGTLGAEVWNNVCQACWREWIGVGTKVINEMGLQLADPRAQDVYDEHMVEFLQLQR